MFKAISKVRKQPSIASLIPQVFTVKTFVFEHDERNTVCHTSYIVQRVRNHMWIRD